MEYNRLESGITVYTRDECTYVLSMPDFPNAHSQEKGTWPVPSNAAHVVLSLRSQYVLRGGYGHALISSHTSALIECDGAICPRTQGIPPVPLNESAIISMPRQRPVDMILMDSTPTTPGSHLDRINNYAALVGGPCDTKKKA